MLTFAIPTYNRVEKLKVCLDSICQQIQGRENFFVTVCNNKSTDSTALLLEEYCRKYSFLSYKNLDEHTVVQDEKGSWFCSVDMAKSNWIWTFGDDDLLLENGLQKVVNTIDKHRELRFLHATQGPRCLGTGKLYKTDSLLKLCEQFGWIDTCGFISSNIVRASDLKLAYVNYANTEYNKGVFAQPSVILEQLASAPAALLDDAIVGLQDDEMTEETKRRWFEKEDHATRYFYTLDAIKEIIRRQPSIPKTLPAAFFRYHRYHLWERHLSDLVSNYDHIQTSVHPNTFEIIKGYATLVTEPSIRKSILAATINLQDTIAMLEAAKSRLDIFRNINGSAIYGWKNIEMGHICKNSVEGISVE